MRTIGVGTEPEGVTVDPSIDTVYVTNNGSNAVSVIDGATDRVTRTIGVGTSPAGVAVDPSGISGFRNFAYVTNSDSNSASFIARDNHAGRAKDAGPLGPSHSR